MTPRRTEARALTRRRMLALAATAPVAGTALPVLGQGAESRDGPTADDLATALQDLPMPHPGAVLQVASFSGVSEPGLYRLDAVVALDWAPGRRQRRFHAQAQDGASALTQIVTDVWAMLEPLSEPKFKYGG